LNIKQFYRILSILLIIAFICISFLVMLVFIAHTCCVPSDCIPCLSLANIQELMRQYGGSIVAFAVALAFLLLLQFANDFFYKTQKTTNLVYMKTRLNN